MFLKIISVRIMDIYLVKNDTLTYTLHNNQNWLFVWQLQYKMRLSEAIEIILTQGLLFYPKARAEGRRDEINVNVIIIFY